MGNGASLGPALLALLVLVSGGSGENSESEDTVDAIVAPNQGPASPAFTAELHRSIETVDLSKPAILYRRAANQCREGRLEQAGSTLLSALRAGFDDVSRLKRDPDLLAIRDHPVYRAIVDARDAADPILARRRLAKWQADHRGGRYRYVNEPDDKIAIAACLDETALASLHSRIGQLESHLRATLFRGVNRHSILVVVPCATDASALLPQAAAYGVYWHRKRLLVAREPGRALRHELVHALHHHHMDDLGQEHPLWIQEGFAALYEAWQIDETDATVSFPANDRDATVERLARSGDLMPLGDLVALTPRRLRDDGRRAYPQLRSLLRFLAEGGHVVPWYRHYIAHFDEDPSGVSALEAVFSAPLETLEAQWHEWVGTANRTDYTDSRP